jgi:outer membrane protein, heavy metal efflux system
MRTRKTSDAIPPRRTINLGPQRDQSGEGARSQTVRRRLLAVALLPAAIFLAAGCSTGRERNQMAAERWQPAQPNRSHAGTPAPVLSRELPENASLDDYLHYAVRHSPALAAAFNDWRAAVERIPQARSLPDPQLSFGYVVSQIDARRTPRGENYRLSQMFPWFGTLRLRGDIASEEALAAERQFEAERWNLFHRVSHSYYEYYFLERSIDIVRSNLELARHLEGVARARFRADGAQQDVLRAQVELGRMDDRLRNVEDLRGPVRAALNAALGRPAQAQLPPPPPTDELRIEPIPALERDAEWIALARETSPELQALRHRLAGRQDRIDLARRDRFPDVMLGVEYGRNADARMAMMDGGGTDMLMGMVSINVPIWFRKYSAAIHEAEALHESSRRQLENRELQLESELKRALYAFRDAERKVDLYAHTLLPLTRQSLRVTESSYRTGEAQGGFLDLVDSQRVLLEFELALERARTDRFQRLAEIERLLGRSMNGLAHEFPNQLSEPNNPFDEEQK